MAEHSALICDKVDPILPKILRDNGIAVAYEPEIAPEALLEAAPRHTIIVVRSRTRVTAEVVARATSCRIVARVGVGLDNIDTAACEARGIRVLNAVEGAMNAVAELVLGLMLSMARHIPRADAAMRDGRWLKKELVGGELRGKYLGIVGMGNIGKRLARLARALNMNIIGYDVVPIDAELSREVGLVKADLDTLFQSSDYVSLHVPLLDSTKNLVDARRLALMKPTARLINTSRGGIVDEVALHEAVSSGRLAGAALDVFEAEPATASRLRELDGMVLTPHIGAQTAEAQGLAANVIGEKIVQAVRGVT